MFNLVKKIKELYRKTEVRNRKKDTDEEVAKVIKIEDYGDYNIQIIYVNDYINKSFSEDILEMIEPYVVFLISFSIDTKDDECSERFKMELKELKDSKYPLFLKKIDEKTAMEVLTGEKFWLNPETLDIVASSTTFKKYSENSLALQTCTFIKPDDFFKLKYAEQGRQEDEFTQWVSEQRVNAKEAFEKGYDDALGEYYANIETAYKLARFDDLVFNLENEDSDRKLKFKK